MAFDFDRILFGEQKREASIFNDQSQESSTESISFEKFKESFNKEKEEQKDIKNEFSIEEESFEDAADDSGGGDGMDDMPEPPEEPSFDDDGGDGGFDDGGSDGGGGDYDGDDSGGGEDDQQSEQDVDKPLGSSLNPFTQINQKLYLMDEMNRLYSSISNAIIEYNSEFAETVELQQLKQLQEIVDEEKESFVMQQNPENIVKYKLYVKQFGDIVRNLSIKIKEKNNV